MDTLRDWYRYLDEVSRPARPEAGDERSDAEWRPWKEARLRDEAPPQAQAAVEHAPLPLSRAPEMEMPEPLELPIRVEQLPSLGLGRKSPRLAEALQVPTPAFEDPTLYDELAPMPEFTMRPLQPPSFELSIPRFGQARRLIDSPAVEAPLPEAPAPVEASPDEAGVKGGAYGAVLEEAPPVEMVDDVGEADARIDDVNLDPSARSAHYWTLLERIRSQDVPGGSPRSRFRESREELLQRLLDPVLTLEETALLLDVCPATVRRYTNKNQLKHFRTEGNQRRFRFSDVVDFLENRVSETDTESPEEADGER